MTFFFDSPNYQLIEDDYDNQPSIFQDYNSPNDYSDNDPYALYFQPNAYNNDVDNLYLNDKNNSTPNETDQVISQKNTSDKSTNNSNRICDDKNIKFDLNESNEKDSSSSINQKDINIINTNTQKGPFNITKERKLGRKTKNSCQKGDHDKYSYDNMTKKLKQLLMNSFLNFVNANIIEEEREASTQKRKKDSKWKVNLTPCLVKIDQNIIGNIKVEYNLNLLNLTLKEIFSQDITSKIKKFNKDYNKKIIEGIFQNKQKEKTIKILNMTLLQCINHLTNKEYHPELQGLECEYENIINKLKCSGETDEYIELFKDLLGRFEEFYKNKRKKNGNKKEKNNEDKIS